MWIVCQIGAREHYAIPRSLHRAGQLSWLLTDAWVPPGWLLGKAPGAPRLRDRWHDDLVDAEVLAPTAKMLGDELKSKVKKRRGWQAIMARNHLFQQEGLRLLEKSGAWDGEAKTVFSYSYAALEIFREAKRRGWTTVLGQIDPGPRENELVEELRKEHPEWSESKDAEPPSEYWEHWREECTLADRIVVNSAWSRSLLIETGVDAGKIEIIPLALEGPMEADVTEKFKIQNSKFTIENPLRVLFLGQAIVRKGIHDLVEAARMMPDGMWQIDVVGPHGPLPDHLPECLRFHGGVPRSDVAKWYSDADVFVLPTHSDGFALTQLEAMAHGVPVIATPACGQVVIDGVNGWIVPPGDPEALADRIRWMLENRDQHPAMSEAAHMRAAEFTLDRVAEALVGESDEKP
ncbi:glycosyltransferase family 4 protein [Akkermansiaceae bacterium]|nr:glycosyltransferase family 4 protein [Akkermansiaceae bacterium]MDB4274698.1 glycosyltransferase family 4 protein [Akkermansiaceae bacterium]